MAVSEKVAATKIQTSWRLHKDRALKLEVREKEDLCMVCGSNELDQHITHLCKECIERCYDVSKCCNCDIKKFTVHGCCVKCMNDADDYDEDEDEEDDCDENTCRTCRGDLNENGECCDCLTELWRGD